MRGLLLLAVLVGVLAIRVNAGSNCIEDLSDPSNLMVAWANSGKMLADPGDFENCRAYFPNTTFCVLVGGENATFSPGSSTALEVILGLCAPASCAQDIEEDWEMLIPYIGKHFPISNASYAKCGEWKQLPKLPTGARILVAIIVMLCAFTFIGSVLGFVEHRLTETSRAPYADPETELTRGGADEEGLLSGERRLQPYVVAGPVPQFFRCFSVFHNLPRLVANDHSTLSFLNGMRVMSIVWVICGHTLLWLYGTFSNTTDLYVVIQKLYMQLLFNAPFSVDTFFFMSGLLVAYLSYGAMTKGIFSWLYALFVTVDYFVLCVFYSRRLYYLHRYVRLTPVYMFWLFLYWKLLPYIATGPLWETRINVATGDCAAGWWTNLLYINNLARTTAMCHPVSWYLANDMQFYIIAPFLVYAFYRSKRIGMALTGALLLGSILANWIYYASRHFVGGLFQQTHAQATAINQWIYMKPWMRAVAYLVGVAAGLFIAANPHRRIHALVRYASYSASAAIALTLLLSPWNSYKMDPKLWWGPEAWAAYSGLGRTSWAVAMACLSIPFAAGYGDFVRRFLGASFWTPLARLTYGVYLIHPLCLSYYLATISTQLRMEWAMFITFISFGLSLVSYLLLEKPLMNLEVWITKAIRGSSVRHEHHHHGERKNINDDKE